MFGCCGKRRWVLGLAAIGLALGAAVGVYWRRHAEPSPPVEPAPNFPVPAYTKSPYLNTAPGTAYIGTAACGACHRSQQQSYLHTAHSRSLGDVDPNAEPPDGTFEHKPSGRSYRVYRKDNQMRHAEAVRGDDGKEIVGVDLPVRYLVGSGNFARTYLVEVDGFLHESPITYYPSTKKWAISPGYDGFWNYGFERPIKLECIFCHAGRTEPSPDSVHRMTFPEKSIGCENCHGPGALHEKRHRAKQSTPGEDDFTIVNPAKLTRSLQEDLCAVCHLSGQASVHLRGRLCTDYRPGTPLSDYRIHYRLEKDADQMNVVGHVEQLQMSACYRKSTMTCLTCHNPHRKQAPKDAAAYYRAKCLECHAEAPAKGTDLLACRLDLAERRQKDLADSCIVCHMPRGDTEIPHIAFTHHRIGRHGQPKPAQRSGVPALVAVEDVKHLAPIDKERNLGLAYLAVAKERAQAEPELSRLLRQRGLQTLHAVHAAGLRDASTAKALADNYFLKDPARAAPFANEILAMNDAPIDARGAALLSLAEGAMRERDFAAAIDHLQKLNLIYRNPDIPYFLGVCSLEQKQPDRAILAFQQALARRPYWPEAHQRLAEVYRAMGQAGLAQEHSEKARLLLKRGGKLSQ